MSIKLFHNEMSPRARAVLLTAAALGLDLDLQQVNMYGKGTPDQDLLKINPRHTIPTLHDKDFVISDSYAIVGYLVGQYSQDDTLYPKEPKKRALVDQHLYFDSGTLHPRVDAVLKSIVVENEKEISSKTLSAITESYKFLDEFLEQQSPGPYLTGPELTIADLCCVATVSTATIIIPISTERYPRLSTWYKTCKNLAYYDRTNGTGLNKLDALVELKLGRPLAKDYRD